MTNSFFRHNSADQDKKLDADQVQVNGLDVYRPRVGFAPGKQLIDEATTAITYIGEADTNALTSAPVWRIRRVNKVGNVTTIAYPSGQADYNFIWDDRSSLSY